MKHKKQKILFTTAGVALALAACGPSYSIPSIPVPETPAEEATVVVTVESEVLPAVTAVTEQDLPELSAELLKDVDFIVNFPLSTSPDVNTEVDLLESASAYDGLVIAAEDEGLTLDVQWFDFDGDGITESAFVNGINGILPSDDWANYWQVSINNEPSPVGIGQYFPVEGDVISLDYKESPEIDALEWLLDHQKESGEFGYNLFQSSFAVMGVGLAEELGISAEDAVAQGTEYLIARLPEESQRGYENDSLYAAVVVMALNPQGRAVDSLIADLLDDQRADGGWRSGTEESDVDTTSWVILALAQAGEEIPSGAVGYLLSTQRPEGYWGYNEHDPRASLAFTEEALLALAAAGHPLDKNVQAGLDWLKSYQGEEGCIVDGFRTALGHMALLSYRNPAADAALACLPSLQNGDGSFGRMTNHSNAMDTAIALLALNGNYFGYSQTIAGGDSQY